MQSTLVMVRSHNPGASLAPKNTFVNTDMESKSICKSQKIYDIEYLTIPKTEELPIQPELTLACNRLVSILAHIYVRLPFTTSH